MENMEIKDINPTEAITEIAEAVPAGKNGLKTAAKVGVIGAASVAAWEFVVKPVGRKIKTAFANRKAAKKAGKTEADDVDMNERLDDIPELDD